MRSLRSRFSDWVVVHPVRWGVASAAVLVLLGFALDLAPIVVIAVGAGIGVLNIVHARRRGYCPLPAARTSHPVETAADQPLPARRDGSRSHPDVS
jgi:hypothetical protein